MSEFYMERYLRKKDGSMPHVPVKGEDDVAPYVLLSGNPARVKRMSIRLENAREFSSERGYVVYTGTFDDVPVTMASSGMGCPSLAVTVEELAVCGGRVFIRTGSCASIQESLEIGDLAVGTAAVRDEGTSPYYAPLCYPAVADPAVVQALQQAGKNLDIPLQSGVIRSTDSFYEGERKDDIIRQWRSCNVLAFEMESSALFTVAGVLGLQAGSIIVPGTNLISGRATYEGDGLDAYKQGERAMIEVALHALKILAEAA